MGSRASKFANSERGGYGEVCEEKPKKRPVFVSFKDERESCLSMDKHEICLLQLLWRENVQNEALGYFNVATVERSALQEEATIVAHGHRIQGFLDTIIKNMDVIPDDRIKAMVRRIGVIHYYKGVNFTAENWLVFKSLIDEMIESRRGSSRRHSRYRGNQPDFIKYMTVDKFLTAIMKEMRQGFLNETIKQLTLAESA